MKGWVAGWMGEGREKCRVAPDGREFVFLFIFLLILSES